MHTHYMGRESLNQVGGIALAFAPYDRTSLLGSDRGNKH
jgi:hypothetical protein